MSATNNSYSNSGWKKNDSGATFCFDSWRIESRDEPTATIVVSDSDRICTELAIVPTLAQTPQPFVANLPLGESYVRQNDFVAIYPEQAPLTFGFQVYYCVKPPVNDSLIVEIWLSVQTSTLESHPQMRLGFSAGENQTIDNSPLRSTLSMLAPRSPGQFQSSDGRCGLIIHPLDVNDCEWIGSAESRSQNSSKSRKPELLVFGGFMEKGVIRRMRLQLVHTRQKMDAQHWQHLVEGFANSPLPLTA